MGFSEFGGGGRSTGGEFSVCPAPSKRRKRRSSSSATSSATSRRADEPVPLLVRVRSPSRESRFLLLFRLRERARSSLFSSSFPLPVLPVAYRYWSRDQTWFFRLYPIEKSRHTSDNLFSPPLSLYPSLPLTYTLSFSFFHFFPCFSHSYSLSCLACFLYHELPSFYSHPRFSRIVSYFLACFPWLVPFHTTR